MEFSIDDLLEKTDFSDEECRKSFKDMLLDRLTFLESERKAAYEKRDSVKRAYRNLETKIAELGKLKSDPAKAKQLEAKILEHATKARADTPSEIYKLLRDDFTYDTEKQEWLKEGKTVEQVTKDFLQDENNSHHILSDVKGGLDIVSAHFSKSTKSHKSTKT